MEGWILLLTLMVFFAIGFMAGYPTGYEKGRKANRTFKVPRETYEKVLSIVESESSDRQDKGDG